MGGLWLLVKDFVFSLLSFSMSFLFCVTNCPREGRVRELSPEQRRNSLWLSLPFPWFGPKPVVSPTPPAPPPPPRGCCVALWDWLEFLSSELCLGSSTSHRRLSLKRKKKKRKKEKALICCSAPKVTSFPDPWCSKDISERGVLGAPTGLLESGIFGEP